jgi:peptidoglycan-associated lipoprotein
VAPSKVVEAPPPSPVVVEASPVVSKSALADFAVCGDRVFFETGRWDLNLNAQRTLDRQAQWLNRNPGVVVRIEGNTDERGAEVLNLTLGQRRAEQARAYLMGRGVAADRIMAISNGKSRPLESGRGAAVLAHNRNAQTLIVPLEKR